MQKKFLLVALAVLQLSCSAEDKIHSVVIVGGGLMGSSTAWQLSEAGETVTLLEKQSMTYQSGSSLGEARIARSLGPPNDIWSYLHNRTVEEARQLIDFLKENDAQPHRMADIYRTSPVSYVRHINQLPRIERILEAQQDSFRFAATPDKARKLFDAALPDTALFLREYKPYSGTINPQALIKKLHRAVTLKGGSIEYHQKVLELVPNEGIFELRVEDTRNGEQRTIKARKVVAAGGPYNGTLLQNVAPYFDQLINPQRVFLGFYRLKPEVFQALSTKEQDKLIQSYPLINSTAGTRMGSNFSMIEGYDDAGNPLIKIGGHFQRTGIPDLDKIWERPLSQEEIAWGRKHILRYFSIVDLPVDTDDLVYEKGYSCVYSLSANEVPYVTLIPANGSPNPNLLVLGAMSGVGAKGALAYGLIGANWLLGREEQDERYQLAKKAMGFERLLADIEELSDGFSQKN